MYYIDFVNIKYFSILSLNYLKSFETKCFLLIFLNWVDSQICYSAFNSFLQYLTLQQLHYQQIISNSLNTIKVEEGLADEKQVDLSEQQIESKSTIESVKIQLLQKKEKQVIKKTKRKNCRKSYNNGHWTQKEHRLYLQFIETNKEIMMKSDLKKQEKIFKQMSLVIKTRSPSQCRSHHQKFNPF